MNRERAVGVVSVFYFCNKMPDKGILRTESVLETEKSNIKALTTGKGLVASKMIEDIMW